MSEEAPNPVDPRVDLARNRTHLAVYRTGLALEGITPTI